MPCFCCCKIRFRRPGVDRHRHNHITIVIGGFVRGLSWLQREAEHYSTEVTNFCSSTPNPHKCTLWHDPDTQVVQGFPQSLAKDAEQKTIPLSGKKVK